MNSKPGSALQSAQPNPLERAHSPSFSFCMTQPITGCGVPRQPNQNIPIQPRGLFILASYQINIKDSCKYHGKSKPQAPIGGLQLRWQIQSADNFILSNCVTATISLYTYTIKISITSPLPTATFHLSKYLQVCNTPVGNCLRGSSVWWTWLCKLLLWFPPLSPSPRRSLLLSSLIWSFFLSFSCFFLFFSSNVHVGLILFWELLVGFCRGRAVHLSRNLVFLEFHFQTMSRLTSALLH